MAASNRNELSRRDFIKATLTGIGGLIGALIGIPSVTYLLSPALQAWAEDQALIPLGQLENYPIGIPTRFEFTRTKVNGWERTATNYGLYVVRRRDREVRVFSDVCTHLGCRVTWHPDIEHYVSPCHDGHCDITGAVLSVHRRARWMNSLPKLKTGICLLLCRLSNELVRKIGYE